MKAIKTIGKAFFLIGTAALCLAAAVNVAAQQQNQDEEVQLGNEVFNQLKADTR